MSKQPQYIPQQGNYPPPPGSPTPPTPQGYGGPPVYGNPPQQQAVYQQPGQYEEYSTNSIFGAAVPSAELHNPRGPLRVGDATITIDGELVPVVNVMLGNQVSIYFEHHILLWKHPGVQISFKSLKGAARRFFAGLQVFMTEAHGPGNISFSRDSVGQIVALRLQPGQMVEVSILKYHLFLFFPSWGKREGGFWLDYFCTALFVNPDLMM